MATNFTGSTVTYTVTVTGTDANGCSSSAVKTVPVKPQITLSSSAPTTICKGSNATLTASASHQLRFTIGRGRIQAPAVTLHLVQQSYRQLLPQLIRLK